MRYLEKQDIYTANCGAVVGGIPRYSLPGVGWFSLNIPEGLLDGGRCRSLLLGFETTGRGGGGFGMRNHNPAKIRRLNLGICPAIGLFLDFLFLDFLSLTALSKPLTLVSL